MESLFRVFVGSMHGCYRNIFIAFCQFDMNKSDINVNASDGANNMDKEIEKIRRISYKIQVDRVLYIFKRLIDKLNILVNRFRKEVCFFTELKTNVSRPICRSCWTTTGNI